MLLEDIGETGLRRRGGGEGRPIAPGAGLAVTADRDIDDGGIEFPHLLIAKAKAGKGAGAGVLDDDVGIAAEIAHDRARFRPVEVDAEIALSRILLRVVNGDVVDDRHAVAPGIPRGWLDLRYICAQIAH